MHEGSSDKNMLVLCTVLVSHNISLQYLCCFRTSFYFKYDFHGFASSVVISLPAV